MKLLLIGNYYYPEHIGGVEIVSHNLVKHYKRAGHAVRWLAADVPPRRRIVQQGDVPIKAWNITEQRLGFPSPIPHPEVLPRLYSSIGWSDVVHLQDCLYSINILAFLAAKLLRKPVLITQYAKVIPYAQVYKRIVQASAYATIGRWMFRSADKLVFITSNVRDAMRYLDPDIDHEVVPLGVDTDFFRPIPNEQRTAIRSQLCGDSSKPLILFVGRLVERKGIGLVRYLVEHHPEWHWCIVGRPDDFNPATWNLSNLTYCPRLEPTDLRDFLCSADLLLHPSRGEGITLTVSEAMACGTPAVISKESLYELGDEDRGLFFAAALSVEGIENALETATGLSSTDALSLRAACRRFAEMRWSWASVSAQYLGLLSDLARGSTR